MFRPLAFAAFITLALPHADAQPFPFVEDTTSALTVGARGWLGAFWGDLDGDLDLDLLVTDAHRADRLYWNQGGGVFQGVEFTVSPFREVNGGGWADVDRDGDLDFLAASIAGSAMLLNMGTGIPPFEYVPLAFDGSTARDIITADYDRDGDPDIALIAWGGGLNLLYRNAGFGFAHGQSLATGTDGTTACWSDYDNDGWVDLFAANTSGDASALYRNVNGVLVEVVGAAPSVGGGNAEGCSWGDYDGDGDLDLFVAYGGIPGQNNRLYRNDDGVLVRVTGSAVVSGGGRTFGSAWGDVDNDGDLDLVVVNRDGPDVLYVNEGGVFEAIRFGDAADGWSLAVTLVDDDGDGDLDLFTTHGSYADTSRNRLYRNTTDTTGRHWLAVDLRGRGSDRFGLGARVRTYATIGGVPRELVREVATRSGRMAQDGFRLHFGLGDAATVDSLVIEWPASGRRVYYDVPVNMLRVYDEEGAGVTAGPAPPPSTRTLRVYPNPSPGPFFVVATGIADGPVRAQVLDALGRRVTVLEGAAIAGNARLAWSGGEALRAGRYVVRLLDAAGVGATASLVVR